MAGAAGQSEESGGTRTRADVRCIADTALARLERAYCGSGRVDATLEVAAADLLRVARAELAEIRAEP